MSDAGTITKAVDALFNDDQVMQKKIADGTLFEFLYRSKIARDFIMSEPFVPDHAWAAIHRNAGFRRDKCGHGSRAGQGAWRA